MGELDEAALIGPGYITFHQRKGPRSRAFISSFWENAGQHLVAETKDFGEFGISANPALCDFRIHRVFLISRVLAGEVNKRGRKDTLHYGVFGSL